MDSQWPVAQRATVLPASWGIGFMVFKLSCPGTLSNREIIKQEFSGMPPLGNSSPESSALHSGSPRSYPPCEHAPRCLLHTQKHPYPSPALHIASKQVCLLIQQTQASSWRGGLPGPLPLPCPSASGVQGHFLMSLTIEALSPHHRPGDLWVACPSLSDCSSPRLVFRWLVLDVTCLSGNLAEDSI